MKLRVKNYIFAGLDFVFDHNYNPFFIEANCMPGGLQEIKKFYGETISIRELVKIMQTRGKNICLYRKKKEVSWLVSLFKEYIGEFYVCYSEENRSRITKLKTSKGEFVYPDSILRYGPLHRNFERSGILVINPACVGKITDNKIKTIEAVRKHAKVKIRIPETYIVHNNKELIKLLENRRAIFEHGFVIKPLLGCKGHGVHVLSEHEHPPCVHCKEVLEERIIPKLIGRKYWDVRVFLVNGKITDGIMRESIHRVTNISKGGKAYKISKKLLNKVKKPAIEAVKAIDKEAEKTKFK